MNEKIIQTIENIITFVLVILFCSAIFWLGRATTPSKEEVVVEWVQGRAEVEYLDSDEIKFRTQFCEEHGWDHKPIYDNGYTVDDAESNTFKIVGVQCKSYSSNY